MSYPPFNKLLNVELSSKEYTDEKKNSHEKEVFSFKNL